MNASTVDDIGNLVSLVYGTGVGVGVAPGVGVGSGAAVLYIWVGRVGSGFNPSAGVVAIVPSGLMLSRVSRSIIDGCPDTS